MVHFPKSFKNDVSTLEVGGLESIGAEKVPGAPGRGGKLSLTRGNFVIPDKGTGIFLENLVF